MDIKSLVLSATPPEGCTLPAGWLEDVATTATGPRFKAAVPGTDVPSDGSCSGWCLVLFVYPTYMGDELKVAFYRHYTDEQACGYCGWLDDRGDNGECGRCGGN